MRHSVHMVTPIYLLTERQDSYVVLDSDSWKILAAVCWHQCFSFLVPLSAFHNFLHQNISAWSACTSINCCYSAEKSVQTLNYTGCAKKTWSTLKVLGVIIFVIFNRAWRLLQQKTGIYKKCVTTTTGVGRQGGPRGPGPPMAGPQIFFVKIEGLLEPVVLNLSFRVRSNAMFTSERRY